MEGDWFSASQPLSHSATQPLSGALPFEVVKVVNGESVDQ